MDEKIYVVVRNYEHDEMSAICFKNKEEAKAYAIQTAKEDHEYFEFEKYSEEEFENCCYNCSICTGESVVIWGYQCENITIELLETILK